MWPQIIVCFLFYRLWVWYKTRNNIVQPLQARGGGGPQLAALQARYEANLMALARFAHLGYCKPEGAPGCLADPPMCLIRPGMLAAPWTREQTCLFAQRMTLVPYPEECISSNHLWVGQLPWSWIRILPAHRSPHPTPLPQTPPDPNRIIVRLDENMTVCSMNVRED
jgi:hypothetical protein